MPLTIDTYYTRSGSIYEVTRSPGGTPLVRRVVRSATSGSRRVAEEWRTAERVNSPKIGESLSICWGFGADEFSPETVRLDGETISRFTITSPIIAVNL